MPDAGTRQIGILGGTFDPIHIGHLWIAEEARDQLGLSEVFFIPAHVSPFKTHIISASAQARLTMVRLAIADNPAFRAEPLEIERPGPSYTIDTLRILHSRYPGCPLFLILGSDSLASLAAWREAMALVAMAQIAVYPRSGVCPDLEQLERELPGLRAALIELDALKLDISATVIRQRVQDGRSIRYLVPPAVEAYIHEHSLYRTQEEGAQPLPSDLCS